MNHLTGVTSIQSITFSVAVTNAPNFIPPVSNDASILPEHQIRTARLYLRPVNQSDLIEYVELFSDPAVMRFVGIEAGNIPSFQQIAQIHGSAVNKWQASGFGRWSMFDNETREFIGFCGFRSEKGEPELICAMHQRFWGKGLGAEAAKACLKYGFESLGFTKVKAFTRPSHSRARKALDKLNALFIGCVDFYGVEGAAYLMLPDSFED